MASEILCTYSFYGSDNVGENYFFIDSSINWNLLRKFFRDQLHPTEGFTIHAQSRLIDSPQALDDLLREENEIHFTIQDSTHFPHPVPKQEEEPSAEEKNKLHFGPTLRKIFEHLGVDPEEQFCEKDQLVEFIQSLPFFPFIKMVLQQPQFLETTLERVAEGFQVDHASLVAEVKDLLQVLDLSSPPKSNEPSQRKNFLDEIFSNFMPVDPLRFFASGSPFPFASCPFGQQESHPNRSEEQKRESPSVESQPQPQQQQRKQQATVEHPATCDNCNANIRGIRYKCMKCPDYDLCESCESLNGENWFHDESHCFAKIYRPSMRSFVNPFCPPQEFSHPPPFVHHFGRFRPECPPHFGNQDGPRRHRETPRVDQLEKEVAELKEALQQLISK